MNISIYWASRLFNQAEFIWNRLCAEYLRTLGYLVILPQEEARKHRQADGIFDFRALSQECALYSANCDVGIYILDGPDVDAGTALEAGIKIENQRLTGRGLAIGVRTDFRGNSEDAETGVNGMFRLLDEIISYRLDEDYRQLCDIIDQTIRKHLAAKGH